MPDSRPYLFPVCLALMSLAISGCLSKTVMPHISADAGELRYPGKFVWFDLHTTDIIRATQFYGEVFGWSFDRTNPGSPLVKTIFHKRVPVGNIFERECTTHWRSFVSVSNPTQGFQLALAAGATPVAAPAEMPDRGVVSMVDDPSGALVGMVTSPVGDPRDLPPTDGYWMGAELWTSDLKRASEFYSVFGGYDVRVVPLEGAGPYALLIVRGRLRGGAVATPLANVQSQWIPQVAVLDILDVVGRAKANGGTILIGPQAGVEQGRTAVFADPGGAIIGVREFEPPED